MGALSDSIHRYILRGSSTMKLVFFLSGLLALVSAQMGMKHTLKNKCIKMTYTTKQVDYPKHVENETILDFEKLAKLKKKKDAKAPKASSLSFDKLKAKFGDKMVNKFKNM